MQATTDGGDAPEQSDTFTRPHVALARPRPPRRTTTNSTLRADARPSTPLMARQDREGARERSLDSPMIVTSERDQVRHDLGLDTATVELINAASVALEPSPTHHDSDPVTPRADTSRALHAGASGHSDPTQDDPPVMQDWIGGKTREELEGLLLEADRVIRMREQELIISASIGKSLLDNNADLKAKHDALLNKITSAPSSQAGTLSGRSTSLSHTTETGLTSPSKRQFGTEIDTNVIVNAFTHSQPSAKSERDPQEDPLATPLSRTSQSRYVSRKPSHISLRSNASDPYGVPISPSSSSTPGHIRILPTSPSALNKLSEDNDELAHKLEELEAETHKADLMGRKKLRRLDKELANLKRELEEALEKNDELETQLHKKQTTSTQPLKALSKAVSTESLGSATSAHSLARHFELKMSEAQPDHTKARSIDAGARALATTPDRQSPVSWQATASGRAMLAEAAAAASPLRQPSFSHIIKTPRSRATSSASVRPSEAATNPEEQAIVKQLMAKIAELQDTNKEIASQRLDLDERLQRAQVEMEGARARYDELEDELRRADQQRQIEPVRHLPLALSYSQPGTPVANLTELPQRRALGNLAMLQRTKLPYLRNGQDIRSTPVTPNDVAEVDGESHKSFFRRGSWDTAAEHEDVMDVIERQEKAASARDAAVHLRQTSHGSTSAIQYDSDNDEDARVPPISQNLALELGWEDGKLVITRTSSEVSSLHEIASRHRPETRLANWNDLDDGRLCAPDDLIPHGGLRDSSCPDENAYAAIEKASSSVPIVWHDDRGFGGADVHDQRQFSNIGRSASGQSWIYEDEEATEGPDPWEGSDYPGLESADAVKERREMEARERHRKRRLRQIAAESSSSAFSGSDDGLDNATTPSTSIHSHLVDEEMKQTNGSRRRQALRRLGLNVPAGKGSVQRQLVAYAGRLLNDGEDDEEPFDHIRADEHDNVQAGQRGADYYPVSFLARYHPRTVAARVKYTTTSYVHFCLDWMKLFIILGIAIFVTVYRGPAKVLAIPERRAYRRRTNRKRIQ
ncbi:uncharacterized protein L969DRAFT_91862 [Mixia osmundae IAM 14324]|uniref:Uncharacterized protein n=1 Tax=Mixia osmundae (strain CBS 9802 / IAM 14324 / JCM 22182 / KY 12970) TaxID=764103 RepID=G7E2U8_MIXOS|nr:uncharacterized protein L969DRAFT_91862 [Mixia osmundae IAM 14324]KEI42418.1 hypothetical protein L969DRAFT_91862 [Mixia osmundae IAM 14324]GAA97292.1 hypothetical protein E5Q_03970 [Mixia osmundae IAM 14324]